MAIIWGNKIITNGLVLYLDANNRQSYPGSGTTWYDLSGNANNCVWNNSPTYDNLGFFTFNGSSNYGTIINNATLDFSEGQTLIIIMKHSYTSGRKNPWDQAYGGYGTWTHESGNTISWYYGDSGVNAAPYIGVGSAATPRDVWNIMCSTRSTSNCYWYLNGNQTYTRDNPYGTLTSTAANIRIGLGYAGYWQGDMAIVMAYNRYLSDVEIKQNFNALKKRFNI